ncbi:Phosphonopyruvate decarboxylase [invertebrate metagenome]|uniref:Phosphonopyruvate decarboxylase n=1 Tax=invertebrate metagenome TaxID=1711999 RepID=A0A484H9Y0_9ZZZZ
MIRAGELLAAACEQKFDFYTGVPCSFLAPLINRVISDQNVLYIGATSEGEAVAIAAGAWLAGRETVVMCQNSGLGNTVNLLTSLNWPFRIPTLLVVTWRGQPGYPDEPQHELMGQMTTALLNLMRVPNRPFPVAEAALPPAFANARAAMTQHGLPFAFIMPKGAVAEEALNENLPFVPPPGEVIDACCGSTILPKRVDALSCILKIVPCEAAMITTTGKCSSELFTLLDREQHFYQVGSMGGASALGLGVALNVHRPVVVLDGDGAALMKMGNIATIGAQAPHNLLHILLDNGVHDSTGGQTTVSASVSFTKVASACGYATATATDELTGFEEAIQQALARPGPHMIHLCIRPGSMARLSRPTIRPSDVARRFKRFLTRETLL